MTLAHGASVVNNDLLMLADAANPRSYPGSGTTWADLSGNGRNGTLVGTPTYSTTGGYFTFNGSTQSTSIASFTPTVSQYSMICWIYSAVFHGGVNGICMSRSGAAAYGVGLGFAGTSNQLGYNWSSLTTYNWISGLIVPNNQWSMVAISTTTTSATLYLNNNFATNSHAASSFTFPGLSLAEDPIGGGRYFNGRISSAQVYNRALSRSEIQQNFNAYRGRYGL
jgi:hypothetical protein